MFLVLNVFRRQPSREGNLIGLYPQQICDGRLCNERDAYIGVDILREPVQRTIYAQMHFELMDDGVTSGGTTTRGRCGGTMASDPIPISRHPGAIQADVWRY